MTDISYKGNDQSMIMKGCLINIVMLKKPIFVKTPGSHFTLKISANQVFGTYANYMYWYIQFNLYLILLLQFSLITILGSDVLVNTDDYIIAYIYFSSDN